MKCRNPMFPKLLISFTVIVMVALAAFGLNTTASKIGFVSPTTTIPTLVTIPRSSTTTVVQVKDEITVEQVFVTPVTLSEPPYEDFCKLAGTHDTADDFIRNISHWGFYNLNNSDNQDHYDFVFEMIVYLEESNWCKDEHERQIIRDSIPLIYFQNVDD